MGHQDRLLDAAITVFWVTVLLVIAWAAEGCVPAPVAAPVPRPSTLASFAQQCVPVRLVQCAVDADLTAEECIALVRPAVDAINAAAGREVYRFVGSFAAGPDAVLQAFKHGVLVIYADRLPEDADTKMLGLTRPLFRRDDGCIVSVITALSVDVVRHRDPLFAIEVVTHEMLHALGFAHAPEGSFPSIMAPAANSPQASVRLSPSDICSIHAVYGA